MNDKFFTSMQKVLFLLLFFTISLFAQNNHIDKKHILVLHSYNPSMSWEKNIDKAIDNILQPQKNAYILHREYMDTKRIFSKKYLNDLKGLYRLKYKHIKFDLILSSDNNSFNFLRKNRNSLFGDIPVVFCGVNFFKDSDIAKLDNFTGVAEEFDIQTTIKVALKLRPNTKNIFIINDHLNTGKAWTKTIKTEIKDIKQNVTFAPNLSIKELQKTLETLSDDTIVILGVYFKDKNGQYFTYEKIGKLIAQHSKVPVFCLLRFNIGHGILGGSVIGGYYQGEAMSKIAKKILNGANANKIPVLKKGATKLIFDYKALEKYNLSVDKLPKNAIILNRPISFYHKHKIVIWISLVIIYILIIIIFLLLKNIKKRKDSEHLLRISQENIQHLNEELENKVIIRTKALEASNLEINLILNSIMEAIIIFKDGISIDLNDIAINMLGYKDKKELIGQSAFDFADSDYYTLLQKSLPQEHPKPYEVEVIKKDKSRLPVLIKPFVIKSSNRSIRLVALIDISEIKQKEKALKKARQKAEDATKSKSEFLANMSHEIRTPMNGILGMIHLLRQTKLNEQQEHYILNIKNSANSLLNLINDILDFSKIEAGKLSLDKINFDILKMMKNVIMLFQFNADEKNLVLNLKYEEKIEKLVYGDSLRISQILINLVGNALKFTDKGEVTLLFKWIEPNTAHFEVIDTGIGLKKEQIAKLFNAFTQADGSTTRKYGGTGLGLSISKQLVKLMNGKIWIESEYGKGSKFLFEIPLEKGDKKNLTEQKAIKKDEDDHPHHSQGHKKLSPQIKQKFIIKLREYASKRRPKLCHEVLDEIRKYQLSKEEEQFFTSLKNMVDKRKYKEIVEITDE